jgi:putative NIF3 family GTP cyclohydrolase 1 type 2
VLLAAELGLEPSGGFAPFQSITVGVSGTSEIRTRTIADRAAALANAHGGHLVAIPFDDDQITRRWGICTGSGADPSTLRDAVVRGLDTLIVGEGPHHTAVEARELGITILYAGHYVTETLGVRALTDRLTREFSLTSTFIDAPTGL